MLTILSLIVIAIAAYTLIQEGVFAAFCHAVNTFFAGVLAFHCWPVLANELESSFQGGSLEGYEDAVALSIIFLPTLLGLRFACQYFANRELYFPGKWSQIGGLVFGAITGYMISGFVVCVMQTLPWQHNFMGYKLENETGLGVRMLPADQFWLRLMARADRVILESSGKSHQQILQEYSARFAKHRRVKDGKPPEQYIPGAPLILKSNDQQGKKVEPPVQSIPTGQNEE
ncbi:MAG: CvpA family protein [Zavarzinella sp.]